MATRKFHTHQTIASYLDRVSGDNVKKGRLPLFYELDKGKLLLFGTDNIGKRDEHSICRLGGAEVAFEGAVELRGHLTGGGVFTRGEGANIRVTGYICGESAENPARIVARDSAVSLGDTHHPERRNILYAHIEAAGGITVYKRPLIHVTLVSHHEDVVLRGQMMDDVSITAPYVSLSTSIGRNMVIRVTQDAVLKGGEFFKCDISSGEGEVFVCAGAIRKSKVTAKYDVDFSGGADDFTLGAAKSENGRVRSGGEPSDTDRRKQA